MYVLGDTLIDTGPKTADALSMLHYIDLKSIKNIVVTHGHIDHHGLAHYIKEMTNCGVFVHKNDLLSVSDYRNELERKSKEYRKFLKKSGISIEFILNFAKYYKAFEEYGENCEAEPLEDTFETEKGVLQVIHTPGHTSGSCCFLLNDVLYSGDTLLPTISTNPSIHSIFDEQCGLKPYEESLKEISQLELEKVLPGHGPIIVDHKKRIQEILHEHNQRKKKVMSSLSKNPQTLVQVTKKVFGDVPLTEVILALAECYDHLKMLEKEGSVKVSEKELYFFRQYR